VPLFAGAEFLIKRNLEQIRDGGKAPLIVIGELTTPQVAAINEIRRRHNLRPIEPTVVFIGKHIHDSRIAGDGYTISDVVEQITSAMASVSVAPGYSKMTSIQNPNPRPDRYGNHRIRDLAVFECSARYPKPELFSVIPKGDAIKPRQQKGHSDEEWPF
jgi:hypothetical protein